MVKSVDGVRLEAGLVLSALPGRVRIEETTYILQIHRLEEKAFWSLDVIRRSCKLASWREGFQTEEEAYSVGLRFIDEPATAISGDPKVVPIWQARDRAARR
jgi:hypothetical protein